MFRGYSLVTDNQMQCDFLLTFPLVMILLIWVGYVLCRVGKLLSKYTSGKIPKALKFIPSQASWEEHLYLTEPDKWSPHALYQATIIFASNMGAKKAAHFYKVVLLPRVREDIRKNKMLHPALHRSLKKACYKQAAFIKGILLPLCEVCFCHMVDLRFSFWWEF